MNTTKTDLGTASVDTTRAITLKNRQPDTWKKAVSYAYATSITANKLGFGSTGCYYVAMERHISNGRIESREMSGHKTLAEAQAEAEKVSLQKSKFSL